MSSSEPKPFHILALSGGGFRGLYTATVLEELEATLGSSIANRFDLICGTSVGGLLAMGLAAEIPTSELTKIFTKHGKDIFGRQSWLRRLGRGIFRAKHSDEGLRETLEKVFEGRLLGDLKHPVLIPTVNYSTGRAQMFKTPHHPRVELDHRLSLVDVALATSAAPVFLPLAENSRGIFCDGGLVGNSPGFFGLHEAKHFMEADPASMRLLAIGTMSSGNTVPGGARRDRGVLDWSEALISLMISAQESSTNFLLQHELGERYARIDDEATPDQVDDIRRLDVVSPAAVKTLTLRARNAAQGALGMKSFSPFRTHVASSPTFFHGPNKNRELPQC
ncbi:CBASS cGAMP-activated phospholipase [Dechloromonas hortensis]|uniref:CBASS cGAMP-activated phospholipase n=1 Tax=Dechloromonas hortensis TaxID=337779 RepID=UPI00129201AB|nr:CBASS cGAMP-activated phospholipase [Dechloromonas hortensis]